jgi:hypothetical protein
MEHRKPKAVSIKLHPDKQVAFIQKYENLLNHIGDDETVLFGDAVRPRRVLGPKELPVAVSQSSCRQRLNIHDASDLETGKTDQPCGKAFMRCTAALNKADGQRCPRDPLI